MEDNILDINGDVNFDERIIRKEFHSYSPFTSPESISIDNIIIQVQQESEYLLLSESGIYLEGKIVKEDGTDLANTDVINFVNNGLAFLFSEIKLEINSQEVDVSRSCGISSALKAYISYSQSEALKYETAGWNKSVEVDRTNHHQWTGYIPLKFLLGFAETYNRIIMNQKLTLMLIKSYNFKDALFSDTVTNAKVQFTKVQWRIPHISVNDAIKLDLLSRYKKNVPINMAFKKWDLHYIPNISQTSSSTVNLKSVSNIEVPRYIIIAFQTGRENDLKKDPSIFDACNVKNLRIYLNSKVYPYENIMLDSARSRSVLLYLDYCAFQESYYGKESEPYLNYSDYKSKAPIYVFDTSKQEELFKHPSTIDIRIEYELHNSAPANTTLYTLIIHDSLLRLYPLTNIIQKVM